jgi:glycine/D-amino acid oxidase-like deaminating enzyme
MRVPEAGLTTLEELAAGAGRGGGIHMQPFWWDAAPPRSDPGAGLPASTDVLIVGAGFTGLSAALTLARAGRQVTVVDADVPGFGASTRNGGQVGSGNQKFRVKALIAMKGERKATELLREGVAMLDFIERLIDEEKIDCDFVRCGRFRGAMRPEHYDAMARDLADLKRVADVEFEMVPRREQSREIGSERFHGGSLLPMDAGLHPGRYHAGLMQRAQAAGAVIQGHAQVSGIEQERDRFSVQFDAQRLMARHVIVATNGYTRSVGKFFDRRIVPVRSAQIATGVIPTAHFDRLMPKRRVFGNSNRVFSYFRSAPAERRIIWGGRGSRFSHPGTPRAYAHLARDLLRAFPSLASIPVTHAWSGEIGYTFDDFPHLGIAPNGVHYALGYCGTGVSRSTYFGRKIALRILGRADARTAFDDMPLPGHPFQVFARPAVPLVEAWYRIRDCCNI